MQRGDLLFNNQAGEVARILVASRPGHDQTGPRQKRPEEFPYGNIEAERSLLQHPVVGRQTVGILHPQQPIADAAVRVAHAFRLSRRAGRVDHVGNVIPAVAQREIRAILSGDVLGDFLQGNQRNLVRRQARPQGPGGEHDRRATVAKHEAQTLGWIVGIERQVSSAGLEDGQQAHDQLHRTLQTHADGRIRSHAVSGQIARQLIGLPVQPVEGERLPFEHHRDRLGSARGLRLDELMQAIAALVVLGRVVPLHKDLPLLGFGQQRQPGDRAIGVGHDRLEQHCQVPQHAFDGQGVEQLDVVLHVGRQAGLGFAHRQPQIELRGPAIQRNVRESEVRQTHVRPGRGLQREEILKQGMAAGVPRRVDGPDQLLEGHFLVLIGFQRGLPDAAKHLAKGGVSAHVCAHHQRVGEEADQAFGIFANACGDRRADREILLTAVTIQQHLEGRQQGHVKRGPFAPAQLLQLVSQRGGKYPADRRPGIHHVQRARTIAGQFQVRKALQPPPPVIQQPLQGFALQLPALPDGEIGVLDRQIRQRRGLGGGKRPIKLGQFVEQDPHRPIVADGVVHDHRQNVLGGRQPQQQRPPQGPLIQAERPASFRSGPGESFRFALL